MKQLEQRLAALEKALANRAPCLQGMSVQDLATLLEAAIGDPYRIDALFNAMSDEQAEQMYSSIAEELAARACLPSSQGAGGAGITSLGH